MDYAQYMLILIAVLPFVLWAMILLVLSVVAPWTEPEQSSERERQKASVSDNGPIRLQDNNLPDISLEHYYCRQMERRPYISS